MILEQILRTQVSDINMSDEKLETESIRTKGCAGVTELMEATKQSTEEKKLVKRRKKIMKQMSLGKSKGVLGTISG